MKDRQKTIESLRRLAERPGTPAEGENARRILKKLEAQQPPAPSQQNPNPKFGPPWPWDENPPSSSKSKEKAGQDFWENFNRDMAEFFARSGYVPRRAPKTKGPVTSWEDMEGVIRRHIYRTQGDSE
jgi:hypothetical protein